MKGIPTHLLTRKDWLNAFEYALQSSSQIKAELKLRLCSLKCSKTMKVLKNGITKPAEEQTPDDYRDVTDPNSAFARAKLTDDEIDSMMRQLS